MRWSKLNWNNISFLRLGPYVARIKKIGDYHYKWEVLKHNRVTGSEGLSLYLNEARALAKKELRLILERPIILD